MIDERAVAEETTAAGISIRTGCFCNPGAIEGASQLTKRAWRRAARARIQTMDQYVAFLGLPSGGAVRASLGLVSNIDDVERFLAFVEITYRDAWSAPALSHPAADVRRPRRTVEHADRPASGTPHLRWVGSRKTAAGGVPTPGRAFYPARRSSW